MNITLSIDERVLAAARRVAAQRGTTVNQLVRDYLADVAGVGTPDDCVAELEALWAGSPGRSSGSWSRDALHERS